MKSIAKLMLLTLQVASLTHEKECPSKEATCDINGSEIYPTNPGENACWRYSLGDWICQKPSEDNACASYTTDVRQCSYEDKEKKCPSIRVTCYAYSSDRHPNNPGQKVCWRYSPGYWNCQEPKDNVCDSHTTDVRECSYENYTEVNPIPKATPPTRVRFCPPIGATCYYSNELEVHPDNSGKKVCWRYSLGSWTCQEPSEDNKCGNFRNDVRKCSYIFN